MAPKKGTSKTAGATTKKAVSKTSGKAATGKSTTARKPAAAKKTAAGKSSASGAARSRKKFTDEEISQKAHEIFLERMMSGEPGDPESDWHKAVERLKAGK